MKTRKQRKHGHTHVGHISPTYRAWARMKDRALNPNNPRFSSYGGRGIKLHPAWYDFRNFIADMGEKPEGKSIDRIDNDGDYAPDNCRWATNIEQYNNQRRSRLETYLGRTQSHSQWSREFGIQRRTLTRRLAKGWTMKQAIKKGIEDVT